MWPSIRTRNRRIYGRMQEGVATVDLSNSSTQHAYTAGYQIPRSTLGVHFNMDMSWKRQTNILQDKFEELYNRISNIKPTTEMTIYYINAVINAALKFLLQVAAIPRTVIKGWDCKHRGLVKKAA